MTQSRNRPRRTTFSVRRRSTRDSGELWKHLDQIYCCLILIFDQNLCRKSNYGRRENGSNRQGRSLKTTNDHSFGRRIFGWDRHVSRLDVCCVLVHDDLPICERSHETIFAIHELVMKTLHCNNSTIRGRRRLRHSAIESFGT